MGGDIRAPVGAEWLAARRAGRTPTLFLKQGILHTPAAVFIHDLERHAAWHPYDHVVGLRRRVIKLLVEHILEQTDYYRLDPDEFQALRVWEKQLADKQTVDQTRGGAGASSVVISPERFTPSDGQLVQPRKPKGNW